MWSGAASAIPSGWNLCDGSNGTPNLVGKFIKGGSTAGATGGSTSTGEHTLTTAQMPSHSHYTLGGQTRPESGTVGTSKPAARAGTQSGSSYQSYVLRPATIDANVGPTNSQGGSSSHSHTVDPVHYTLCYIIKT
jgi:microcystin-dependent protein